MVLHIFVYFCRFTTIAAIELKKKEGGALGLNACKTTAVQAGSPDWGRCEYVHVTLTENIHVFKYPTQTNQPAPQSLTTFILAGSVQNQKPEQQQGTKQQSSHSGYGEILSF